MLVCAVDEWVDGSSQLGTLCQPDDALFFTLLPPHLLHPPSPIPHPEPTTMAHAPLRQWSQLGMILHVRSHWEGLGWWAAVWFPVSRSGSSADPCKSCSSDRSSFLPGPMPQVPRYIRYIRYMGYIMAAPPAATMTLDRFVGPLSADSSPPPLPAIVAARGCRQGAQGRVRHAKSTAKDHPDHVPSQRELEGTRRLRSSTLGPRLAENPLRPRSCRNLTGQRG